MSTHQKNKTKVLSDRDHCLARPQMYLGGTEKTLEKMFVLNTSNNIIYNDIHHVPILTKMVFEIINNCIDEHIRTNGEYAKNIQIDIDDVLITVRDDGRGIPSNIEKTTKLPSPVVCVTQLKAGGNFDHDATAKTQGQNGVGSAVVNILSTNFKLETNDGKYLTNVECSNNMHPDNTKYTHVISEKSKTYTYVKFTPDFKRFGVTQFSDSEISIIKKFIIDQSMCYPGIKFTFNGKVLKCNSFPDYVKYYTDTAVISENKHCDIAIFSGDENTVISFVNGLHTVDSGTHCDYVKVNISNAIREKYKKKYQMSPNDIFSNLHFIIIMKDIISPRFTSQTKTKFSTPISKMKYAFEDVNFKKFAMKICSKKELINPLLQIFKFKEEIKKKKELTHKERDIGKAFLIPKLIDASTKNKALNRLYLAEGDSALNKFSRTKDVYMAGFPLRGKFISCWNRSAHRLMENNEVFTLCKILGLKLTDSNIKNANYAEIVIMTDADPDGNHISGLLLEFFYKFWPDYIKQGKIFRAISPLVVLENGTKFYSLEAFKKYQLDNNMTIPSPVVEYNKGLGSLDDDRYSEMLNTLQPITYGETDSCYKSLQLAFSSKHNHKRKEWLS